MSDFQVIPAIELRGGMALRYESVGMGTRANRVEPLGFARKFIDAGAKTIHIYNLDGPFIVSQAEHSGSVLAGAERNLTVVGEMAKTFEETVQLSGGIRDIEFTVQILQLLNGGRIEELRMKHTLDAIRTLGRFNILKGFESFALTRNYEFLRRVEHRLQIEGGQQRHALPQTAPELDDLARRLGYASGKAFMNVYRERTQENRDILNRFVTIETPLKLWLSDLLNPYSDGRDGIRYLADAGFLEPERVRKELLSMSVGPEERPHSIHVRKKFATIAPSFITALTAVPDPDSTVTRLERVLARMRAPGAIYDILNQNNTLINHLVLLASNSEYLTDILMRDPGLFDLLTAGSDLDHGSTRDDLEQQLAGLANAYVPEAALYRLRDAETLRIGMRELFGKATILRIGDELTQLAEVVLCDVLRQAREKVAKRFGPTDCPFAILGLGKLGGFEMGYGSDLDLVFVYDADGAIESGMAPSEYFAAVASTVINLLKERTRFGRLYDVDARLRPDGKKGMLTVSSNRIVEYYLEDAQPWERLALVKVRAIAGHELLKKNIETRLREVAFDYSLTRDTLASIESIRQRIVADANPYDLKHDEGGLAEIEFGVRLLQLWHAADYPDLRRGDAVGALDVMAVNRLISSEDFAALMGAFLLLRKIQNRIRMTHGLSGSSLPESPQARADLARRLDIHGDLLELVTEKKRRVHETYTKILATIPLAQG